MKERIFVNYMKKDEYHFLYYFLSIMYLWNNCNNNPEFDIVKLLVNENRN